MHTHELFGKEVLDSNANQIGKITDIDVDMLQGIVNYMIVKGGLTKKLEITLDKINKVGDKVILKVTENEL
jgi:sporulation protein YlmC with PRC-barrel domain